MEHPIYFHRNLQKQNKTFFIPASGYRNFGDSQLSSVSSYGRCWSAAPSNATYGYGLYFYSSRVYPQYNFSRAYGFSVRPVQE